MKKKTLDPNISQKYNFILYTGLYIYIDVENIQKVFKNMKY